MAAPCKMAPHSQRSRFLPIRSKRKVLNKYELLRHPSSHNYIDIWQLYKHIRVPTDKFLCTAPAIFYTNRSSEVGPFEHMGFLTPLPCNTISFHPQFLSRLRSATRPFIAAASLLLYDLDSGKPYEFHMTPIIFFPRNGAIHIVDTANHTDELNRMLKNAIIDGLKTYGSLHNSVEYITQHMWNEYRLHINLQKDETDGYCITWTAGMIERLGGLLDALEAAVDWEELMGIYKKFYIKLIEWPTFGKEFYNRLAMRTHGCSRVSGVACKNKGDIIAEILREYLGRK